MIKTFTFLISKHQVLNTYVLEFFRRIEFETGPFDDSFFDPEFLPLVQRHPNLLRGRLEEIYNVFKRLPQDVRSTICNQIVDSNDIKAICYGTRTPVKLTRNAIGIKLRIRQFFIDLYDQVLNGQAFEDIYQTTLLDHFRAFRSLNGEITICPICGISDLKSKHDEIRDQYDHYLPKSLYPYSAVNFENLVPACNDCNSPLVKGNKDILNYSTGLNFFPFDVLHKGITLTFTIINDDIDLDNIEWGISYTDPQGNIDQVKSWRDIYKIDSRYIGLVKGKIELWFKHFWEYKHDSRFNGWPQNQIETAYFAFLEKDDDLFLDFIRMPALQTFIDESVMAQAEMEAGLYA